MSAAVISGKTTGTSSPDILVDGSRNWLLNAFRGATVTVGGRSAKILANTATTLKLGASFHPSIPSDTPYSIQLK